MLRIGMLGLGKMGMPIAHNFLERGFEVIGYRRHRHGGRELVQAGGRFASSPADVAAHADVIVSILPDADAVRDVVEGPLGTLATMQEGAVHIEMSTIDVDEKARIRQDVVARGGEMLDAPISGSPSMVAPRQATTFASGDRASVVKVSAVLDAISGPWIYTGPFGTGARMKYIANMLVAVHTAAAAEAMALARHSGLDLDLVQRTLDTSIASSAIWRQRGPAMQNRTWTPAPGPIDTLHAILEQIEHFVDDADLQTPVFRSAKTMFDKAVADGWGALDIASVHDQVSGVSAFNHKETV
ncbi:NAD(P)-dependent oxidoreductase [Streptomyces sp. NPDC057199]|uniref:NAD(P)-dependent oxidoreductase n=1 Tax=Streptomyces sp. NPDC057199 TaxID=3346047 RepID=UPI00363748EB